MSTRTLRSPHSSGRYRQKRFAPVGHEARASAAARLCHAHGVSVEEVCARGRISHRAFLQLVRDGRACCNTARRLARIIGCSPDVFLMGTREPAGESGVRTRRFGNRRTEKPGLSKRPGLRAIPGAMQNAQCPHPKEEGSGFGVQGLGERLFVPKPDSGFERKLKQINTREVMPDEITPMK